MYIPTMEVFIMVTTIQKWGNSQGIRIPKYLLDAVEWNDDEQLVLTADKKRTLPLFAL